MRIIALAVAVFAGAVLCIGPASAQTSSAIVVASCGTPPATYTAGQPFPLTQDTTGKLCDQAGGGGATSSNITQFGGTNISTGTGTGGAGIPRVTVSSDSFPSNQSVNTAQINGVTTLTGTGATGTGSQRVTVATDSATVAGSASVPSGTNNIGTLGATGATTTNGSSTVATGNTFQSALASNGSRKGCMVQNPTTATEALYLYFGANGSATTATSISLSPGAAVTCAVGPYVLTDNVSVTAATTGHAYILMSQ